MDTHADYGKRKRDEELSDFDQARKTMKVEKKPCDAAPEKDKTDTPHLKGMNIHEVHVYCY